MGLQSAMTTALTGLQAAETTIDVVGNNVANSNTVGFKESNVLFATQFYLTQSVGSAPSTGSGGTNPRQIGLGATVAEIAPDFTQGTIQVSSNPLDLAIQGDGFFIVQGPGGSSQQFYTRNGQFKTNSENEIITVTGERVMGYGVDEEFVVNTNEVVPLSIPLGGAAVAQETNNVNLVGNLLPDNSGISTQPGVIDSVILSDNSREVPDNLAASDVIELEPADVTSVGAAAGGAGTGSIAQGTYRYKLVFVDPTSPTGFDEGPPSEYFGEVSIPLAGTDSIDLTTLPTSSDPSVFTLKRLYRIDTTVSGDTYKLVAELSQATTTYTDTTATASLGAELDEQNLDEPTSYNYFITFAGPGIESRPTSVESTTIPITLNNRRIRLEDIPQPTSGDYTTIRIYRNIASDSGDWYRLDELPIGTTSYIDNKSDDDISGNELLDRNGPPVTPGLALLNVSTFDGTNYVDLFQEGTLQFTGSKGTGEGLDLDTKELEITSATTVLDLMNFMQQALGILTVSPDPDHPLNGDPGISLVDSQIHIESNDGVHNAIHIDQNALRLIDSSGTPSTIPLTFSSPEDVDGNGTSSEMIVYDSLGIPLSVRLTTALESTTDGGVTTYRWYATSPDNQEATGVDTFIGTGLITFDGNGKFISATDSTMSIERREVAANSPVTVDLDFSQVTALHDKSNSMQASSQDGFAAGTLASFSITESGLIKGVYTNGVTRDLGQLVMARFANNNGLQQLGENLWAEGVNSGEPLRDIPGSSGLGTLTAGAVELSNTDIGQNLIDLILASTQYRGGSRVITTAQQLLDELLALRR